MLWLSGPAGDAVEALAASENVPVPDLLNAVAAFVLSRFSDGEIEFGLERIRVPEETETRSWLKNWERAPRQPVPDTPFLLFPGDSPRDRITIAFDPVRYSTAEIAEFVRCLNAVLERIPSRLEQPLSSLDILPDAERLKVLDKWNHTAVEYPAGKCVHELIEAQAERTPDVIAVVFEDRAMTYRELNARANRLARALVKHGVGPDSLVGICMERSPDLLVAMLAVLKAGGGYVPLDPAFPKQRIHMMLDDSGIRTVLLGERVPEGLIPEGIETLSASGSYTGESAENPGTTAQPGHIAYMIYTSGSTGKPKGVMVEHRNVVNFFTAMDPVAGAEPAGVWLAVTSISFDISVLELLWTLSRGFRIVLLGDRPAGSIASLVSEHGVTHLQCTPSLARIVAADPAALRGLGGLRKLLLGGEAVPLSLVEQLRPWVGGEIHNMYGPTETTVWSTTHWLVPEQPSTTGIAPIGRPIANTQVYILDAKLRPVPPGVRGELYIGGAGVVRGYWKRPELTAERFLPDPFQPGEGNRIYRTGDVARHRPDGVVEYLGRLDHQVKIRGFRIELGEIEKVLEGHPAVRQAVVHAREDKPGDQRLIAYVVFQPGRQAPPGELRGHLENSLPDYMAPAAFVALDSIPLTANGKIDRKSLPSPEGRELRAAVEYAAPEKEIEKTITGAWRDALGVPRIGLHDNFFDLGAHSLLVAEVHIQLRQALGKDFPLLDMFQHPTVHALAEHLSSGSGQPANDAGPLAAAAGRGQARRESMRLRGQRRNTGGE
jgi:amino acid adenylation domain-containing protein